MESEAGSMHAPIIEQTQGCLGEGRRENGSWGRGHEAQNILPWMHPSFMDIQPGCASVYGQKSELVHMHVHT